MSETIVIVAIVCIATLGLSTIVAISTYRRDKFQFWSNIKYKDLENKIAITSSSDSDKKESKK